MVFRLVTKTHMFRASIFEIHDLFAEAPARSFICKDTSLFARAI